MTNELVPLHDPRRCKKSTSQGQCEFKSCEGSDYCEMHGGKLQSLRKRKRSLNLDRLNFEMQVEDLLNNPDLYLLDQEILMLDRSLNAMITQINGDDQKLVEMIPRLEVILKLSEKLKKTGVELKQKTNNMVSKSVVYALVQEIINILGATLKRHGVEGYEEIIQEVTEECANRASGVENPE